MKKRGHTLCNYPLQQCTLSASLGMGPLSFAAATRSNNPRGSLLACKADGSLVMSLSVGGFVSGEAKEDVAQAETERKSGRSHTRSFV